MTPRFCLCVLSVVSPSMSTFSSISFTVYILFDITFTSHFSIVMVIYAFLAQINARSLPLSQCTLCRHHLCRKFPFASINTTRSFNSLRILVNYVIRFNMFTSSVVSVLVWFILDNILFNCSLPLPFLISLYVFRIKKYIEFRLSYHPDSPSFSSRLLVLFIPLSFVEPPSDRSPYLHKLLVHLYNPLVSSSYTHQNIIINYSFRSNSLVWIKNTRFGCNLPLPLFCLKKLSI